MKKIIIMMLFLVALGIISADIIEIKTDMNFDRQDITVRILGEYNLYYPYPTYFNEQTRELTVADSGTYTVSVDGESFLDFRSLNITEWGIDLRTADYYLIEKYFDRFPHDPGTPINQ